MIVGNPPYRKNAITKIYSEKSLNLIWQKYAAPRMDLWFYFVHRVETERNDLSFRQLLLSIVLVHKNSLNLSRKRLTLRMYFYSGSLGSSKMYRAITCCFASQKARRNPYNCKRSRFLKGYSSLDIIQGRAPVHVYRKKKDQVFRSGRIDLSLPLRFWTNLITFLHLIATAQLVKALLKILRASTRR